MVDAKDCVKSIIKGNDCIPNDCKGDCMANFGLSAKGQCLSTLECRCTYPC